MLLRFRIAFGADSRYLAISQPKSETVRLFLGPDEEVARVAAPRLRAARSMTSRRASHKEAAGQVKQRGEDPAASI
jgi:hypothetical protein